MLYNDRTAKRLKVEDIYPEGANSLTSHAEYECPCGKGRIVYERVIGFNDYYAIIECKECREKYNIRTACGCLWELEEK